MKTNAARILDGQGIRYEIRSYEVDEKDLGAAHVAASIGMPLAQVFKTLVVKGDRTGIMLVCLPGEGELDLKALAAASGNKKADLVPLKDVQPLTGYVRGGVSPMGAKKKYPVFLDNSAASWPVISISAGARGYQIILSPCDLSRVVAAQMGYFTMRL